MLNISDQHKDLQMKINTIIYQESQTVTQLAATHKYLLRKET